MTTTLKSTPMSRRLRFSTQGLLMLPLLCLGLWAPARGQELLQSSPEYAEEVTKLRSAPESNYKFEKAALKDVLRFLAEDAGISFMALSETEGDKDKLVTFNIVASPFSALETVASNNGVALLLDRGIWHMRPLDDQLLIGRTYHIKYSTQDKGQSAGSGGGLGGESGAVGLGGGGGGGGGGFSSNLGGGGVGGGSIGGAGGGMSGMGTGFQDDATPMLESNADEMLSEIERIVGIKKDVVSAARTATVDDFGKDPLRTPQRLYKTAKEEGDTDSADEGEPAVFWDSDTNNLFVVCTRAQHLLIEEYLKMKDRPQPLVAVEVKFFETTRDPRKQMGVDWSATLDGGIPVEFSPITPTGVSTGGALGEAASGTWSSLIDWKDPSNSLYPQGAILSSVSARVSVQALLADRDTVSTSYPRVLTQNNREVVIKNVVNKPVLASSSSTTPGVGGTTTASIQYLPIGTTINILPKAMSDGTVHMQVKLSLSNIVGSEVIAGNAYPVASSRAYNAPLKVESGYTVAIAGLDEAFDSRQGTGVPVLSKIPLLGYAFKNTERSRSKKSLMMFITPTVLGNDTPGLSETPISTVPVRKEDPARKPPQIYSDGALVGGIEKLPEAILWADYQERFLRRMITEQRATAATSKDVALLRRVIRALKDYVGREMQAQPEHADKLALAGENLDKIGQRAGNLKLENWKNSYSDFLGH